MYKNPIKTLHVDLISACNARCPFCFRQTVKGNLNAHFPKNQHLNLDLLIRALKDPVFSRLEEMFFCGNFGDALASPQIVNVIDAIDTIRPDIFIDIHTNGSLGSKNTWIELGKRLQNEDRFVKFAIDGLEDTNSIYRRGVSWNKVMENARTYIDAGGKAIWKFVVFQHNKHQLDEARALANKMGFKGFHVKPNYSPQYEPVLPEENIDFSVPEIEQAENFRTSQERLSSIDIECDAEKSAITYIDFAGHLWPCCWLGGWKYSADKSMRDYHHEQIEARWGSDFNSLHHFSPSEVLSHPWFQSQLQESWTLDGQKKGNEVHHECVKKCGKAQCSSKALS